MGAYNALGDLASSLVSKFTKSPEAEAGAKELVSKITPLRSQLEKTQSGKLITEAVTRFNQRTEKYHGEYAKAAMEDPNALRAHFAEQTQGEPPELDKGTLVRFAKKKARVEAFGKNDQILQQLQHAAGIEGGHQYKMLTHDYLNTLIHDEAKNATGSTFDRNMVQNKSKGLNYAGPTSDYKRPGFIESAAQSVGRFEYANKAGLMHMSTPVNLLLTDNTKSLMRVAGTLLNPKSYKETAQYLNEHNAFAEDYINQANAFLAMQNGKLKNYVPGSVAEFIYKNIQIPGMGAVRHGNLLLAGMATKATMEQAVKDLMSHDPEVSRIAEIELGRLKLNPDKILANDGQLTKDDIEFGLFNGIDYRTQKSSNQFYRSYYSRNTSWGRIMTMYHQWPVRQGRLIADVLKKEFFEKGANPENVLRIAATLGIVFPTVGNIFKSAGNLVTGKDWDDPAGHFEAREKEMYDFSAPIRALTSNIEAVSHLAGFGMMTGAVSGALRFHLMNTLAGPLISNLDEHAEDAIRAGSGKDATPLARDLLSDLGLPGRVAANKLLPNTKQKAASKPRTFRQIRAASHPHKPRKNSNWYDVDSYLPQK